ncbi:glycosyltransferase [Methanosphaera cuniculi]|uniref:glycosyltransferase family protein n=1 Tax=Methanosphaera cuniculi TaxID=1077256 RepID=UPI0026F24F17|nr:glycosyltransferase [Methanosphaera cuniculi]
MKITEKIKNNKNINKIRILKNSLEDYKDIQQEIRQKNKQTSENTKLSEKSKKQIRKQIQQQAQQIHESTYQKLNPLISIIINTTDNIENLLIHIQSQTYQNIELIILNTTNNDFEYESDYTIVEYTGDKLINMLNEAICGACGEYILFLDNNTRFDQYFLENLINNISTRDKTALSSVCIIDDETYQIHSNGISFKKIDNTITPVYTDNRKDINFKNQNTTQIIAPSSKCFIARKDILSQFLFNEKYDDLEIATVDLALRLFKENYTCYNIEFIKIFIKNTTNKIQDNQYFNSTWKNELNKWFYHDKIYADKIFSKTPLTVAFVVTQSDENTTAGDFFTAETLANSLEEFGWNTTYLSQNPSDDQNNWYFISEDVDVIISLLDRYDISKIQSNNNYLKIAWIRNWFERWTQMPYFTDYNIILTSSMKSSEYIKQTTGCNAIFYPLATDPCMFNKNIKPKDKYICDYCFTGSFWNYEREIINCLNPDNLNYKFNLYGLNWQLNDKLKKYHKGFISYDLMPDVYASTSIVIDDANHVTVKYGSVNSRIFDAIAMGKLIITNGTLGNMELFDGLLPEYHSEEELTNQINYYMKNPQKREKLVQKLQKIVLENHTYQLRAESLFKIIKDYYL